MKTNTTLDFSALSATNYKTNNAEDISRFASQNHLTFAAKAPYDNQEQSEIFRRQNLLGNSMRDCVSGELRGMPYRFFSCELPLYNRVTDDITCMSVTLPQVWPHLVITSVLAGKMRGTGAPMRRDESQRLVSSDALFNKYFKMYAPEAYKNKVAAIFLQPEFLNTIMQYAPMCTIEIVSNKLYIFSGDHEVYPSIYRRGLVAADAIIGLLQPVIDSGDLAISQADSDAAANQLGTEKDGRFIAKAMIGTFAVTVFVSYFVIVISRHGDNARAMIVIGIFVLAAAGVAMAIHQTRNLLKKSAAICDELRQRFGEINEP